MGLMLLALVVVKRVWLLPMRSVRYNSTLPLRLLWKTTIESSCEREGRESIALLFDKLTRLASEPPSTPSSRKICRLPVRNEWNMIQFWHVSGGAAFTVVMGGGGGVGVGGLGVSVGCPGGVVGVGLGVFVTQIGSTSPCAARQLACKLPF